MPANRPNNDDDEPQDDGIGGGDDGDILNKKFRNRESGKIYVVFERSESMVRIRNITDGRTFQLPYSRFQEMYEPYEDEGPNIGFIVVPDERHDFNRIILNEEVRKSIDIGVAKIMMREELNEEWGLKHIDPMSGKCALNFFGPPGCGKSISVLAVARQLEKKVLQVDYSQIISKWVGETAKNIKAMFDEAKKENAILFFDEADSLLSKRVEMSGDMAFATSINQNRNVLMQEIDKFDGIIVFATNLFSNYDEALLRRIAQHVEFPLPDQAMRKRLFELHLPPECRSKFCITGNNEVKIEDLAKESKDFSGGDIKNACINAIIAGATSEEKQVKQVHFLKEIQKIREAKQNHKGGKKGRLPHVGFGTAEPAEPTM